MTTIRTVDLGTFVASSDAAAKVRQGDGVQQRLQQEVAAQTVQQAADQDREAVPTTNDSHRVNPDDEESPDAGTYDPHGRTGQHGDSDSAEDKPEDDDQYPHLHVNITV